MTKRILGILMLILGVYLLSGTAMANTSDFEVSDGVLIKYHGTAEVVYVPDWVTSIGHGAFYDNHRIKEVVLPSSVTSIGQTAFYNCYNLQTINIPDGVTYVGKATFNNTPWFEKQKDEFSIVGDGVLIKYNGKGGSITIPSIVKTIGGTVFYLNHSLTSVKIPDSVEIIGYDAFNGCSELRSINLPSSIKKIEDGAFESCRYLVNVEMDGYVDFDLYVFRSSPWYKSIIQDFVIIGDALLAYRGSDSVVKVPSNIKYISSKAFAMNSNITYVEIPDSVIYMGEGVFSNSRNLKSVRLSNNLTDIKTQTFTSCSSLEKVNIPNKAEYIGNQAFTNCRSLESIELPNTVTWIGKEAFYLCSELKKINLPDSLKSIGKKAFYRCTSLVEIAIPDGITVIEDEVFDQCLGLQTVKLPKFLTSIGTKAFWAAPITNIEVPKSVKHIGYIAFYDRALFITQSDKDFVVVGENILIRQGKFSFKGTIVIPSDVVKITGGAFEGNSIPHTIIIPTSVTYIGDFAFKRCTEVKKIIIPETVNYMGESVFEHSPNVKIYGSIGSYAHQYAKDNGIPFEVHKFNDNEKLKANPSSANILVDGKKISFDAYNINNNTFFKLRDLAYVLGGTQKQFDVSWDNKNKAINLISNKSYTVVGGEMLAGDKVMKYPLYNGSKIFKDNIEINLLSYTIDGNNYFKLRDIAQYFDIGINWNQVTQTIEINTKESYIEP